MLVIDDPLNMNIVVCDKNLTIKIRNNKIDENHVKNVIVGDGILINFVNGGTLTYNNNFTKIYIPTLQEILLENGFTLDRLMNTDPVDRDRFFLSILDGQVYKLDNEKEILI